MYRNIGRKIKILAQVFCWIGVAAAVIGGIVLAYYFLRMNNLIPGIVLGILTMVVGSLLSWIGSWLLYGYGEMIDKLDIIERNTRL